MDPFKATRIVPLKEALIVPLKGTFIVPFKEPLIDPEDYLGLRALRLPQDAHNTCLGLHVGEFQERKIDPKSNIGALIIRIVDLKSSIGD